MASNVNQSSLRLTDLLPELLSKIATLIDSPTDIKVFRSTCTSVRSSTQPPSLVLFPTLPGPLVLTNPSFIPEGVSVIIVPTSVFLLRHHPRGEASSWLVGVEQPSLGTLRRVHPLSKDYLDPPRSPLCGYESVELSRGVTLKFEDKLTPVLERAKVVVWDSMGERYLMMLQYSSRILECVWIQTGSTVYIRNGMVSRFDDIVCRDGMILALEFTGRLYRIEYLHPDDFGMVVLAFNNPNITTFVESRPLPIDKSNMRKRLLLDSNGDLYLVVRKSVSVNCKFQVFKLNEVLQVWEDVVSLGDRVLFITADDCFFAWASDLGGHGFQGNCIVFPKDVFPDGRGFNVHDEMLFHGASENYAIGVYKFGEGRDFTLISSLRGYSDLFRPLPPFTSDDKSSSIRESEASSKECLIEYADDQNEEVQMAVSDQNTAETNREVGESSTKISALDHLIAALNHEIGEPSDKSHVPDQLTADPNREVGEPSERNIVEDRVPAGLTWSNYGIISVPEAQPGEPPRVISNTDLTRRLEISEVLKDGCSSSHRSSSDI